jgi:hypothetical protein
MVFGKLPETFEKKVLGKLLVFEEGEKQQEAVLITSKEIQGGGAAASNLIKSLWRLEGPVRDPPKEGLMPNVGFTALEHQLFNREKF